MITDVLGKIIAEDKSLLARPDEFVAKLEERIPGSLARQANSIKIAMQKQVGELLLLADAEESYREQLDEEISRRLTEEGMRMETAQRAAVELIRAMNWDGPPEPENLPEEEGASEKPGQNFPSESPSSPLLRAEEPPTPAPLTNPTWICTCGTENSGIVCTICGMRKEALPFPEDRAFSKNPPGEHTGIFRGANPLLLITCLILAVAVIFLGAQNMKSSREEPAKTQSVKTGKPLEKQQANPLEDARIPEEESEIALGKIPIGLPKEEVYRRIGREREITDPNKNHYYRYQYKDMEVVITNGVVTGFVSKTPEVSTTRGIHQGSSLQDVLNAYGDSSLKFSHEDMMLYEYRFSSIDHRNCLLRFAIKNDQVDYISGRIE